MDIKSEAERSRNMSRIRSTDTKPEVYLRKLLFREGFRYRKNDRRLPGCPDIYLPKYRTVIFVHGCFWHRHEGCRYAYTPKSRTEFWTEKFRRNVERDKVVAEALKKRDLKVIVIWECSIRRMMKGSREEAETLQKIETFITEAGEEGTEYYELR